MSSNTATTAAHLTIGTRILVDGGSIVATVTDYLQGDVLKLDVGELLGVHPDTPIELAPSNPTTKRAPAGWTFTGETHVDNGVTYGQYLEDGAEYHESWWPLG